MFFKFILSVLIILQLSCNTTSAIVYTFKGEEKIYPYSGAALAFERLIWQTCPPKPFSKSFWDVLVLIDLPFTLVFDTILLPVSFPYYLYVESGSPGSKSWYYKKWKEKLYTFIAKNSANDILNLTLEERDSRFEYQELLKSISRLEERVLHLQKKGIALNKDLEYLISISSNGKIDPGLQLKQHVEIVGIIYEQFREHPELESSYDRNLWGKYFEIVWRNFFSKGFLIRNPDVLKKILDEFSNKKDAAILFQEIASFYSEEEYDKQHFSYFVKSPSSQNSFESLETRSNLGFPIPKTNQEFWKNQIQILLELDRMIRRDFTHLKNSLDPVWEEAISSGVVSYNQTALEKVFQEFPKETKVSIGNIFKKVIDSNNLDSIQFVGRHISDFSIYFASDRDMILRVLGSPKILEKLLQAGLDPNRIYGYKKSVFVNDRWIDGIEEDTFLILCLEDSKETSISSLQLLLKYGAKTDLAVKRYSRGKDYLYSPHAVLENPDYDFSLKRKIFTEWTKKKVK
ncbi:YceK/YidQ family lipoprotein [Leptospira interrogans]|uniref:YceK/YidQ family lipoprotein n=1 Tax=Leptospira interrogans TaxID=173 RepID=UPI000297A80D|nr:YceK/YidQ family lipoprotein [Leptospira interrogans]EKR80597.1 PF07119 family protein [Leptospira interrogans str. UI 08452]EMN33692.1 PF07119 family protein [Leptospira interrogans serovar Medanensis str. L0448]EMN41586.1 PF07119 family protein [Leptospira interrogans str. L0996]EMN92853.1 PF07119 family protein [Leptospira interrogans serovar Medanensis str. UT053]